MSLAKCEICMTECEHQGKGLDFPCFSFRGSIEAPEAIPPMDQIEEEHRLRMIEAGKQFGPDYVGFTLAEIEQAHKELVDLDLLRRMLVSGPDTSWRDFKEYVKSVGGTVRESNVGCFVISVFNEDMEYTKTFGERIRTVGIMFIYETLTPKKPEDLVPTMKLRFKITAASNKGNIESPVTLQQWWLDRNVINSNGTAGGGRWVDIPVETE